MAYEETDMKAKEARELALSVESGRNKEQYNFILNEIRLKTGVGEFKYRYYKAILPGVKTQLESDGYTVMVYDDQREGFTITISW